MTIFIEKNYAKIKFPTVKECFGVLLEGAHDINKAETVYPQPNQNLFAVFKINGKVAKENSNMSKHAIPQGEENLPILGFTVHRSSSESDSQVGGTFTKSTSKSAGSVFLFSKDGLGKNMAQKLTTAWAEAQVVNDVVYRVRQLGSGEAFVDDIGDKDAIVTQITETAYLMAVRIIPQTIFMHYEVQGQEKGHPKGKLKNKYDLRTGESK